MYSPEQFDIEKTRVMKYILYKRRTEQEVRIKFENSIEENMLEDIIQYLKGAKYLNDQEYIEKAINNFKTLKSLSLKELKYKLLAKGLNKNDIEDYMYDNNEELEQYEIKSAKKIFYKKQKDMEDEEIKQYLLKKGYKMDSINKAINEWLSWKEN